MEKKTSDLAINWWFHAAIIEGHIHTYTMYVFVFCLLWKQMMVISMCYRSEGPHTHCLLTSVTFWFWILISLPWPVSLAACCCCLGWIHRPFGAPWWSFPPSSAWAAGFQWADWPPESNSPKSAPWWPSLPNLVTWKVSAKNKPAVNTKKPAHVLWPLLCGDLTSLLGSPSSGNSISSTDTLSPLLSCFSFSSFCCNSARSSASFSSDSHSCRSTPWNRGRNPL